MIGLTNPYFKDEERAKAIYFNREPKNLLDSILVSYDLERLIPYMGLNSAFRSSQELVGILRKCDTHARSMKVVAHEDLPFVNPYYKELLSKEIDEVTFGLKYTAQRKAASYHALRNAMLEHLVSEETAETLLQEFYEKLVELFQKNWKEFPIC